MSFRIPALVLSLVLLFATAAPAAPTSNPRTIRPTRPHDDPVLHGGPVGLAKAVVDTIDLMGPTGSGAAYIGDFEQGWAGWTARDVTQATEHHWQVSDYNQAVAGNLAAWCGDIAYPSCNDSLDVVGGYGNAWDEFLAWRATVADPASPTTVSVTATLQYDTEPAYDYVHLSLLREGQTTPVDLAVWDGTGSETVSETIVVDPTEYRDGTDLVLYFRFTSDGGWSDADCQFFGAGACQIDDITVTVSQAGWPDLSSFTDFQDGTFGDWAPEFPPGVGNFAQIWSGLRDLDPCRTNVSHQVAFIDDGFVVPGTGGSPCIDWCYGPGGYVLNTTGGLAGPDDHLYNEIISPVMAWPEDAADGILFAFDAYRHEEGRVDSALIIYGWGVRSADTDGSGGQGVQDIAEQPFLDRGAFGGAYTGGPDYRRHTNDVTDLMNPGRDEVQVQMIVMELGWLFGYLGDNASPAPYFDNVSVKIFPHEGPGMSTRWIDLANDSFPEIDAVDLTDPGSFGGLHVRFDMARNISLSSHLRNDPGDSLVIRIAPVRTGAALAGTPEFHYAIDANPVFDAYRTIPSTGVIPALGPAVGASGMPTPDMWAFDIPDTGSLFPGDVMHWYVKAGDQVGADVRYATYPADITGFGDFSHPSAYDATATVRGLPTLAEIAPGEFGTPPTLFWNDFANRGGDEEWYGALDALGMVARRDYDIYDTNGASSGVGNGLGGRTAGPAIAGYDNLLYTAGDLGRYTLSNGDFDSDPGDDIGTLRAWLETGDRDVFLTGDSVVADLVQEMGTAGIAFGQDVIGVDLVAADVRSLVANQTAPLVVAMPGNPVFTAAADWIAYGACPTRSTFDAVIARPGAMRLAEFTDPNRNTGVYPYAAATLNLPDPGDRVVSLPYGLMAVHTQPGTEGTSPRPSRTQLLADVLAYFGAAGSGAPSNATTPPAFAVAIAPNPCNPRAVFRYSVGSPGHLSLKLYDVRGALVRTLHDGQVRQSGRITWDGTDERGRALASGVYFSEARLGKDVRVDKVTLVR